MGSRTVSVMVLSSKVVVLAGCLFGLGLLGRLLAAYSSGDKDEDKGNCKCNRRTFHTKEKKCNCDCLSSGYGAPSYEYQPPSVGYTSPVDSYGAPVQSYQPTYDSYGAPVSDYGAPSSVCACDRTFGNHKEKDKDKKPCDCSSYPTYDYGPPAVSYSYGAPAPSYNPPCTYRRTFNKEKDKDKKPCYSYFYRL